MRLHVVKVIFVFALTLISFRLFYWQVVRAEDMQALAEEQHVSSQTIEAPRGVIYASDHSVLATNQPSFLLYGLPQEIEKKTDLADKLSRLLYSFTPDAKLEVIDRKVEHDAIDSLKNDLLTKLNKELMWVPLDRNLNVDEQREIEKLKLPGLGFETHTTRYYPEGSAAAHLLGFVANDAGGKPAGYFGLEGFYNGELRGQSGSVTEERDAAGSPILTGKFLQKEAQNGHNLVLNIDRTVQFIAEKKLKEGMQKYGAKGGYVVIMNPSTGGILAMASYPNYDPSHIIDFPKEFFRNPVVADSYEPGSTFKVLNMAAAINEHLVTPDTICDICGGPVDIANYTIRTWNNQYAANSSMTDVIVHSDNTGMVFVARKLGLDKMYQYITDFGFGVPTNIDLQDETSPDLRPKKDWHEIDIATASFGQGIAATGIQMVRAVGAIANGGKLMEPHIVREIESENKTIEIAPKVVATPITEDTAKQVTGMMVEAVIAESPKPTNPKGFKIAGKTGTAQIPVAGHYDANKTIASFVGFAPADNPRFVMLVRYSEPSSSIFGADTAAPTFFGIAKELFNYYGIPPTE
jgi:cell division protein FtsI (penicillin-binding protein 3)